MVSLWHLTHADVSALWPSSHASWLGLVSWLTIWCCRLQCKPLEHVSFALPWSSSLVLAMQHGVHQSGLANQGSAVHWAVSCDVVIRGLEPCSSYPIHIRLFCLILEANLEAGPHVKVLSFWSSFPLEKLGRKDNRLYGLVQAPWSNMKNHEPQSDTLKESRTIKRTWTQSSKPSNNISDKDLERNNVKEKPSNVSMFGTVICAR